MRRAVVVMGVSASGKTLASWSVQAFIDRSIAEFFVDGGVHAGTVLFYPTQPLTSASVAARDLPAGAEVSVAVWSVASAWAEYEDENGTVVGNVTQSSSSSASPSSTSSASSKRYKMYEGKFVA